MIPTLSCIVDERIAAIYFESFEHQTWPIIKGEEEEGGEEDEQKRGSPDNAKLEEKAAPTLHSKICLLCTSLLTAPTMISA